MRIDHRSWGREGGWIFILARNPAYVLGPRMMSMPMPISGDTSRFTDVKKKSLRRLSSTVVNIQASGPSGTA